MTRTRASAPARVETPSGRIGFGAPQVVAWYGDDLVFGTSSGAYVWDIAAQETRQIVVGDVVGLAVRDGEIFVVDAGQSQVVIARGDGTVRAQVSLAKYRGRLTCGALSPDGTRFVVGLGSGVGTLVAIDTRSGDEVFRAVHKGDPPDRYPTCAAFSPDGTVVATSDADRNVWLWNARTGKKKTSWPVERGVTAMAFTDAGLVGTCRFGGGLIARSDRFLRVYDANTGTIEKEIDTPTADRRRGDALLALALSPDGTLVAVGGKDGAVHVFQRKTWKRVVRIGEDKIAVVKNDQVIVVASLAFSADGSRLAVAVSRNANLGFGENEYLVEVWSTKDWKRTHLLDDCVDMTWNAIPLSDGRLGVATSDGLRIYAADLRSHEAIAADIVGRAAVSPDGARAIIGSYKFDGAAMVIELATRDVVTELETTEDRVRGVAYGDDNLVAVVHADAWIFQVGRKTPVKRLKCHEDAINGCAAHGTRFAFASWDGKITWLDATKKSDVVTSAAPGPRRRLTDVAFSPDGKQVAVSGGLLLDDKAPKRERQGRVWIVDCAKQTWTPLLTRDERMFEAVTWSPDGVIAAGDRDGALCRWDAASKTFLGTTIAHGAWITGLASAPGRIYSTSEDGTVGVWSSR